MTLAILIAISLMWLPVGLLFLGYGEAKGTGAICAFVGICVVIAAFVDVFQNDAFTAGLLFAHGLLYCVVAYALLAGLTDLRSMLRRAEAVWPKGPRLFPIGALTIGLAGRELAPMLGLVSGQGIVYKNFSPNALDRGKIDETS